MLKQEGLTRPWINLWSKFHPIPQFNLKQHGLTLPLALGTSGQATNILRLTNSSFWIAWAVNAALCRGHAEHRAAVWYSPGLARKGVSGHKAHGEVRYRGNGFHWMPFYILFRLSSSQQGDFLVRVAQPGSPLAQTPPLPSKVSWGTLSSLISWVLIFK